MFDSARAKSVTVPPVWTFALEPMYAPTVGETVTYDSEPLIDRPPTAVPRVFASASGSSSAVMSMLFVRSTLAPSPM